MREDDGQEGITERVAAILAADAVRYSRLMADDEKATIAALDRARAVFSEHIEANRARVVDTAGDSVLSVFETTNGAVRASVAIQEGLAALNEGMAEARRMPFRIGIHLGDIHEKADGTVYGDGVNVAARLEALSDPGSVTVSASVRESIRGRVDVGFEFLGEHEGKNLSEPARAFKLVPEGTAAAAEAKPKRTSIALFAAALAVITVVIGGVVWRQMREPDPPQMVTADGVATEDPVLAMPTGPSVAVLPFTILAEDEDQRYFANGVLDNLIAELTRSTNLIVILGQATHEYAGENVDIKLVGDALNARFLIEGSIQRVADQLRVTVRLGNTETGNTVWSEKYDRSMTLESLFAVQDEIVRHVVGAIAGTYGAIYLSDVRRDIPTENITAYDYVVKAKEYWSAHHSEDWHVKARDLLESAVELDPQYGVGWAYLTWAYLDEVRFGYNPLPNSMERAHEAALKAVELAPFEPVAHWALSAYYFINHEVEQFLVQAERTIQLAPNDGSILNDLGNYMVISGHAERGYQLVQKAAALNPMHPNWWYFGMIGGAYWAGDYEEALSYAQKLNMKDYYWQHAWLAVLYGALERRGEAKRAVDDLLELYPDFGEKVRDELRIWNSPEGNIEAYISHLRAAGLDVPEQTN